MFPPVVENPRRARFYYLNNSNLFGPVHLDGSQLTELTLLGVVARR
jgi:hypothetical protein